MVFITRRATFSASHRLYNPSLSEQKNLELFDKCANPNGHGHNYVLEVTVAGMPGNDSGYVLDLKALKQVMKTEILDKVDHKHLNHDVDFMRNIIPTAENIVIAFWNVLVKKIPQGMLHSVKLSETENNAVEYRGEKP